jgi:hypothetical protein
MLACVLDRETPLSAASAPITVERSAPGGRPFAATRAASQFGNAL